MDYDEAIETIRAERAKEKADADLRQKRDQIEAIELSLKYAGDGTVAKFSKTFVNSDRVYQYAAINTNGRWYTTGQTNSGGFTHEDFVLWLASGNGATIISVFDEM